MLVVICDDLANDREILLGYCARYAKENHLPVATLEFENAGALLNSRKARSADAMFLDIYMDGALGVDAARILRSKGYLGTRWYLPPPAPSTMRTASMWKPPITS